jgi:hypothetical protein
MKDDLFTYLSRSEFWIFGSALVTLLIGTWVFRGAPPGQSGDTEDDMEAPRAGYRDRIVVAVVVGLILIMGGAYVAIARGILWSLPIFALGFGLVLALISFNQRYRHASPSLRRTIDFSSSFLNAALLAGILIVFNVMAFRYGGQPLDMTREQTYSLSSMTITQLLSLKQPVTFTSVFGRGPRAVRQRERVLQLLESFKSVNPAFIEIDSVDPYSDLTRGDELLKRVPELEILHGGGIVIEYGEGEGATHVVVRNQDLFHPIQPGGGRSSQTNFASAFTGEDEITSALVRLREGKRAKVAFTTGHGEAASNDLNPRGRGVGNWKARLSKVGCEVIDLNMIQEEIPADLSLLIVVSPKTPFKAEEVAKLKAFAAGGGPVMLLVGPEPSGLDDFLKSFNLAIRGGLVVDPRYNFRGNLSLVFAPTSLTSKHPIIEPLGANRAVLLPGAAPIQVFGQTARGRAPTAVVDPALVPTPIILTTTYSWAENNPKNPPFRLDPEGDQPGPVTVGVAVAERAESAARGAEPPEGKPRLALFSCPGIAENIFQEYEPTNLDLLMNTASWLRNRPDTQGIPPHTHVALTLSVDPFLRSRLILVPSAVAAMLIVATGITVYVARRQ